MSFFNLTQFDPIWSNLIQDNPNHANLQQLSQTLKSKDNKEAFRTAHEQSS